MESPSWPALLNPQHASLPVVRRTQVKEVEVLETGWFKAGRCNGIARLSMPEGAAQGVLELMGTRSECGRTNHMVAVHGQGEMQCLCWPVLSHIITAPLNSSITTDEILSCSLPKIQPRRNGT